MLRFWIPRLIIPSALWLSHYHSNKAVSRFGLDFSFFADDLMGKTQNCYRDLDFGFHCFRSPYSSGMRSMSSQQGA